MSAARISVVMPVYNRAAYVAEAIESVLAQTRLADELIVVDDGSTDDSLEVIERYAGPRLHVVRQQNGGIGAARNRGLADATGELVAFLDSDDIWERDKLERQLRAIEESDGLQLVFGHIVEFLSPDRAADLAGTLQIGTDPMPGLCATTLLLRREALRRIGSFDEKLRVGEFIEWMARANDLRLATRVLPEVVARRRVHGGNTVLTRDNTDYLRAIKATLDRRRTRAAHAG